MSRKYLFSISPVLRFTTIIRASSRFLAGCWAMRLSGKSNLNCESFMGLISKILGQLTQTGGRSGGDSSKPGLTAPRLVNSHIKAAKLGDFGFSPVFFSTRQF